MSLKKKTVHSIFWTALQQFGRQGFGFVFSIILARLLMPEEFGYVAMVMVFINICITLIDSGLTQSLIREDMSDERDYSTIFFFNLVISLILYLILYFGAPYVGGFYDQPILHNLIRWQGVIIIIHALTLIQETLMIKNLEFKRIFYASLPSIIIAGCVALYMAYKGYGVYSIVAYSVLDTGIMSGILWFISPWQPKLRFHTDKFRYHFRFGAHLSASNVLETLFNELYNIILGKYFSPAHLGFFNRAYAMQRLPVSNLAVILNKVTYPIFARIKSNNQKLKEVYGKLMLMVIFLLTPVLLFAGILAVPLFRLILTEKWLPAVPYFKILCLAGIIYPLNLYNVNILKIKGASATILRLQLYKKIIFVLSLGLIVIWGLFGLLYGIVINAVLAFLLNSHYSGNLIQFPAYQQIRNIFPLLLISFISAVLLYLFYHSTIGWPDSLQLVSGFCLGILIYSSLVLIFERRIIRIAREIFSSR